MTLDRSFVQANRSATERLRQLTGRLSEVDLQHPMFDGWTVSSVLVHLAFWDRRVLLALDWTEHEGKVVNPEVEFYVNDILAPLLVAIPAASASRLAVETAETVDKRLEGFREDWLEQLLIHNKRMVFRAMHRNEHLDDIQKALKSRIDAASALKDHAEPT